MAEHQRCSPGSGHLLQLVQNLRNHRIMCDGGNGNVYDIADEDCERAADFIELHVMRAAAYAPAWQPIETAPQDGSAILATGGGLGLSIDIVSYNEHVGAWNATSYTLDDRDDEPDGYSRPSHWMPLPDASSLPSTLRATTDRNLVESLCDDCPPVGYETDRTRCMPCPRRASTMSSPDRGGAA